MPLTRRSFLGSTVATVGLAMPGFLRRAALAAPRANEPGGGETVLVVVQLTGGNDGLNTVIPHRDPAYHEARPTLAQPSSRVLSIDDDLAFHPAMQGFATLLEASRLAIVQGVGYPNGNRSHFESMDVWHRATDDTSQRFGWLGKARAHIATGGGAAFVGEGDSPLALYNATGNPLSLNSLRDQRLELGDGPAGERTLETIGGLVGPPGAGNGDDLLGFVRNTSRSTLAAAERFRRAADDYQTSVAWPATGLANRLKVVAQMLDAGSPERIYYTTIDGFDTHSGQAPAHERLVRELADAIAAFQEDVSAHGHGKRVVLMTFSEFGRRVRENGSQGTDHGAGSQMFLVGERVKPGVYGAHPSLIDLEQGDLRHHTDFRRVYATVLETWLRIPAKDVLEGVYEPLPLLEA